MANCLVTGGTGFLGKFLVKALISDGHEVCLLVRRRRHISALQSDVKWQPVFQQVSFIEGDLCRPDLGLPTTDVLGSFDHIYHLAAIYDLEASADELARTNVEGTHHLLEALTKSDFRGTLHFVSSIAIAGDYSGVFRETMFDEGQQHHHPYHRSKFESEKQVRLWADKREQAGHHAPVRIYRPSAIVGDSETGYAERIDGPYFVFNVIARLRKLLPSWMPVIAPGTRTRLDMVPVDYVARAILVLSQCPGVPSSSHPPCFHLTDPNALSLTRLIRQVLRAADGPRVGLTLPAGRFLRPSNHGAKKQAGELVAIRQLRQHLFEYFKMPEEVLSALMPDVVFDNRDTRRVLEQYGVILPDARDYLPHLWDFYHRHLEPFVQRHAQQLQAFRNKTVLITGASSGIGFASTRRALELGAHVVMVARNAEKLNAAHAQLVPVARENGGKLEQRPCDVGSPEDCEALIDWLDTQQIQVDILFNNAGKSIRRSLSKHLDRFHDLERTMQVNYYGAARLMLALLPRMEQYGGGQIIYSSTMGTMAPTPRFGPYLASKSAMDALMDSLAAEYADKHIQFTSIKFPLIKTEMIAPTREYKDAPAASPEFAANLFVEAVVSKPRKKITGTGQIMGALSLWAPAFMTQLYNYAYRVWPDHSDEYPEMALDRMVVQQAIRHSPL